MANIKSQKKRIITSRKANAVNRANRSALRTTLKKANTALTADGADKDAIVADTFSAIDKAVRKGALKKNTANRRKAAIAKAANKYGKKNTERLCHEGTAVFSSDALKGVCLYNITGSGYMLSIPLLPVEEK